MSLEYELLGLIDDHGPEGVIRQLVEEVSLILILQTVAEEMERIGDREASEQIKRAASELL